jgi:hypothetical protein
MLPYVVPNDVEFELKFKTPSYSMQEKLPDAVDSLDCWGW